MTKEELIAQLMLIAQEYNENHPVEGHSQADRVLLKYINDEEITKAFQAIRRWYG